MSEKLLSGVLGVLCAISIGLAGWSLSWTFEANAKLALVEERLRAVADDREFMERTNRALMQHWRLHSWERDQIYRLRTEVGLPQASWPDLGAER